MPESLIPRPPTYRRVLELQALRISIRLRAGARVLAEWLRESPPRRELPTRTFSQRLLDVLEHPYFINPAMAIAGLIGMFLLTPILVLFGICVLLSIHRTKAVEDKSRGVQLLTYGLAFVITTIELYWLGEYVKYRIPQLATRSDIAAILEKVTKSAPAPKTNHPETSVAPPAAQSPAPKINKGGGWTSNKMHFTQLLSQPPPSQDQYSTVVTYTGEDTLQPVRLKLTFNHTLLNIVDNVNVKLGEGQRGDFVDDYKWSFGADNESVELSFSGPGLHSAKQLNITVYTHGVNDHLKLYNVEHWQGYQPPPSKTAEWELSSTQLEKLMRYLTPRCKTLNSYTSVWRYDLKDPDSFHVARQLQGALADICHLTSFADTVNKDVAESDPFYGIRVFVQSRQGKDAPAPQNAVVLHDALDSIGFRDDIMYGEGIGKVAIVVGKRPPN